MILLIQELQEKYDLLDENLNSIMILLIQSNNKLQPKRLKGFKFHYDSINSITIKPFYIPYFVNLNSIMILLIRNCCILFCLGIQNLNSIMILLIRVLGYIKQVMANQFKFHYDSINSS